LNLEGYPEAAPINAEGVITPKGQIVARLNQFFDLSGAEFLETRPASQISWGLYLPYAHLAAWQADGENSTSELPRCGAAFMRFQSQMLDAHLDFGLVNLQAATSEELQKIPFLILETGNWMDRATQEKLAAYARSGGKLILVGKAPEMDENFQLCACLADKDLPVRWLSPDLLDSFGLVKELVRAGLPAWIQAKNEAARDAFIWVYTHPDRDVQYLFILSGKVTSSEIEFSLTRDGSCQELHLRLPRSSGGILRLENGRLTRAYLRGANDYLNEQVAPYCRVDQNVVSAATGEDLILGF
jgi:beta-galactosidase